MSAPVERPAGAERPGGKAKPGPAEPAEAEPAGGPVVRAAGGVVWRHPPGAPNGVQVLVVHRPHRHDWSFPKGKNEPGEDDEDCARREVAEETGLRCRLGADLGTVDYRDARGRPKSVHWWAMTPLVGPGPGEGTDEGPDDEVDELRWLAPEDAARLLSYDTDRTVLQRFGAIGAVDRP